MRRYLLIGASALAMAGAAQAETLGRDGVFDPATQQVEVNFANGDQMAVTWASFLAALPSGVTYTYGDDPGGSGESGLIGSDGSFVAIPDENTTYVIGTDPLGGTDVGLIDNNDNFWPIPFPPDNDNFLASVSAPVDNGDGTSTTTYTMDDGSTLTQTSPNATGDTNTFLQSASAPVDNGDGTSTVTLTMSDGTTIPVTIFNDTDTDTDTDTTYDFTLDLTTGEYTLAGSDGTVDTAPVPELIQSGGNTIGLDLNGDGDTSGPGESMVILPGGSGGLIDSFSYNPIDTDGDGEPDEIEIELVENGLLYEVQFDPCLVLTAGDANGMAAVAGDNDGCVRVMDPRNNEPVPPEDQGTPGVQDDGDLAERTAPSVESFANLYGNPVTDTAWQAGSVDPYTLPGHNAFGSDHSGIQNHDGTYGLSVADVIAGHFVSVDQVNPDAYNDVCASAAAGDAVNGADVGEIELIDGDMFIRIRYSGREAAQAAGLPSPNGGSGIENCVWLDSPRFDGQRVTIHVEGVGLGTNPDLDGDGNPDENFVFVDGGDNWFDATTLVIRDSSTPRWDTNLGAPVGNAGGVSSAQFTGAGERGNLFGTGGKRFQMREWETITFIGQWPTKSSPTNARWVIAGRRYDQYKDNVQDFDFGNDNKWFAEDINGVITMSARGPIADQCATVVEPYIFPHVGQCIYDEEEDINMFFGYRHDFP